MNWISVKDRLPEIFEQEVLVIGFFETELYKKSETPQIGLVTWGTIDYSPCKDYCYYDAYYKEITHWMPLPKQLK